MLQQLPANALLPILPEAARQALARSWVQQAAALGPEKGQLQQVLVSSTARLLSLEQPDTGEGLGPLLDRVAALRPPESELSQVELYEVVKEQVLSTALADLPVEDLSGCLGGASRPF